MNVLAQHFVMPHFGFFRLKQHQFCSEAEPNVSSSYKNNPPRQRGKYTGEGLPEEEGLACKMSSFVAAWLPAKQSQGAQLPRGLSPACSSPAKARG